MRQGPIDVIVVTGSQPGPGLWKVWKDGHVLWLLGTVQPLPADIGWEAKGVEDAIAQSTEYIAPPRLLVEPKVGLLGGLMLMPAMKRLERNAGDATLRDVLPAPLYARWEAQRRKYLPDDRQVERKRPMFAAGDLYRAALRSHGLGGKPVLWPVLDAALKRHGVRTTETSLKLAIDDPRAAIREFEAARVDDVACMQDMLQIVEAQLPTLVARANAWSVGDYEALRGLPVARAGDSCMQAWLENDAARKRGIANIPARLQQLWLNAAEAALARNDSTFAMLPMSELLGAKGYLATLKARGYEVEEP